MKTIEELSRKVVEFRDARDWAQFHNPKDSAISLLLEATEVLEHFQWKNKQEVEEYLLDHKDDVGEELADVLYWVLLMSNDLGIDLSDAFEKKLKQSGEKYPIEKAKGNHKKYSELK